MNEVIATKVTPFGLKIVYADGYYEYVDAWLSESNDESSIEIQDEASIEKTEG